VVVFGIDGADAEVFERLRSAGRLSHFDALAKRGSYARLATTNPAQSPVSWAAFSTGSNPGKTGIFDFLRRDPDAPGRIELSLARKTTGPGPLAPWQRALFPFLLGAAGGLLAFALVSLLLRPFRAVPDRGRRIAGIALGLAAAVLSGVALHRFLRWIPDEVPKAVTNRGGTPLWVALGEAGVPTLAIEAPVSFPADRARNLEILTGLGTPDVQGHWGFYSVFTEDSKEPVVPETGGFVDALAFDASGTALSRVYGPQSLTLAREEKDAIGKQASLARRIWEMKVGVPTSKRFEERVAEHASRATQVTCVLEIRKDAAARTATVRVGSGGPRPILDLPLPTTAPAPAAALPAPGDASVRWSEPVALKEHAWSDYVPFEFAMNPAITVKGIGKFWLESAGAEGKPFRLVLTPVSFDPRDVPEIVDVCWPRTVAPSLASQAGLYSLVGWPCLTNPVKDSMLTDEAFLAHVKTVTEERRRKLQAALARQDWRFLFVMFSEVDRIQHAFWRHVDPKSPMYDAVAAKTYGPAIDESYVAMDGVLGEIQAAVGEDAAVLVLSDHGFAPFRRGVNLNTWLIRHGLQAGRVDQDLNVNQIFSGQGFFQGVDWSRTRAYALGLGDIFLNLKGREREGCVAPEQADAVAAEIRGGLLALRDTDGTRVVHEVYLGKDLYSGPAVRRYAPDLVVGFEKGYRVSWQTCLGGGGSEVLEDNRFPWSGDHCSVDPSLVPGILVSSTPLRGDGASVMDVAPTVLDLFGVQPPPEWDGKSLLPR
jgi:predicted AlkP superfamily phosphohydrolase/phosphomutase